MLTATRDLLLPTTIIGSYPRPHWFVENLPGVETPIIKPRESWVDDPNMRAEVTAKGDAAILGVGL